MTHVIDRDGWDALPARQGIEKMGQVYGLAVHHSGQQHDEHADHANCQQTVRAIQRGHMTSRGWSDIAYNWLACRHDVLYVGRALSSRSASQGTDDGNAHWLSVCVLGDGGPGFHERSEGALRAVLLARALVVHVAPIGRHVRPHSAFHATECPGADISAWLKRKRWP